MMKTIRACLAVCLLCAATPATVAPMYRAGEAYGITFFWTPVDPIQPDTLAWHNLCRTLQSAERPTEPGLSAVATALAEENWKLVRARDCSAMALALLVELGHPVCVLSQWHATLKSQVKVSIPGMSQKHLRHMLVSDFHWESVERTAITPASSATGGYRIQTWFTGHGYSEYRGDEPMVKSNQQVLGGGGLVISSSIMPYSEDLTIVRTGYQVMAVIPASLSIKDLTTSIEKAMDSRKLDMSYRAPAFAIIEAPPARPKPVPPQPVLPDSTSLDSTPPDSTSPDTAPPDSAQQ